MAWSNGGHESRSRSLTTPPIWRRRSSVALNEAKFRKAKDRPAQIAGPSVNDRLYRLPSVSGRLCFRFYESRNLRVCLPTESGHGTRLNERLIAKRQEYIQECGENAYALMNVVTDLATQPQVEAHGYSFIRRERHTLQRLAGAWVAAFGRSLADPSFNVSAYLERPTEGLLQRLADRQRTSGSGRNP